MIGRQLIEAMRREPALPEPGKLPGRSAVPDVPAPGNERPEMVIRIEGGAISEDDIAIIRQRFLEAIRRGDRPTVLPEPPARILGYAVARYDAQGRTCLTHTSLMPYSEAQREAGAQRKADRGGYSWAVVEIRRAG